MWQRHTKRKQKWKWVIHHVAAAHKEKAEVEMGYSSVEMGYSSWRTENKTRVEMGYELILCQTCRNGKTQA